MSSFLTTYGYAVPFAVMAAAMYLGRLFGWWR